MSAPQPGQPVRIQLFRPLQAVKLEEHPGSSLRNATGTLVEIAAGAILEIEGAVAPSGLCNVLWSGEAFSVFYEELRENGRPLGRAK